MCQLPTVLRCGVGGRGRALSLELRFAPEIAGVKPVVTRRLTYIDQAKQETQKAGWEISVEEGVGMGKDAGWGRGWCSPRPWLQI